MAVRTKNLHLGVVNGGAGDVVLFTCPAERTIIIKSIALWLSSARTVQLKVRPGPTGGGVPIWTPTLASQTAALLDTWVVLEPGDRLEIEVGSSGQYATVLVSGAELDGVAP